MILDRDQLIAMMDGQNTITKNKNSFGKSLKRKGKIAIRNEKYRWPNNTIYFYISSNSPDHGYGPNSGFDLSPVSEAVKATVRAAVETLKIILSPCLNFIELRKLRTIPKNMVYIYNPKSGYCSSAVGYKKNRLNRISLNCSDVSEGMVTHEVDETVVIHEFFHTLGLLHTHSRPDRDEYVEILENNLIPRSKYNFHKFESSFANTYNQPYDFLSIMHYPGHFLGIDGAQTIRTIDPKNQDKIGQGSPSLGDISLLKRMYGCPETTTQDLIDIFDKQVQRQRDKNIKYWLHKNFQLEIDEKDARPGTCLYQGVRIYGDGDIWQDNCRMCSCQVAPALPGILSWWTGSTRPSVPPPSAS